MNVRQSYADILFSPKNPKDGSSCFIFKTHQHPSTNKFNVFGQHDPQEPPHFPDQHF